MRHLCRVGVGAGKLFGEVGGKNHAVKVGVVGHISGVQNRELRLIQLVDNIFRQFYVQGVPYQDVSETSAIEGGGHIHGRGAYGRPQHSLHLLPHRIIHRVTAGRDVREHPHVEQPLAVQLAFDRDESRCRLRLHIEQHAEVLQLVVGLFRQPPLPHDERRRGNRQQILDKQLYIRILQIILPQQRLIIVGHQCLFVRTVILAQCLHIDAFLQMVMNKIEVDAAEEGVIVRNVQGIRGVEPVSRGVGTMFQDFENGLQRFRGLYIWEHAIEFVGGEHLRERQDVVLVGEKVGAAPVVVEGIQRIGVQHGAGETL